MTIDFTDVDAYITMGGSTQALISFEDPQGQGNTTAPLPLRAPKTVIPGLTEYEQSPQYGDLFAQGDFSGGMGQQRYHGQNRDARKYWYSEGLDISVPGRISTLYDLTPDPGVPSSWGRAQAIANGLIFVIYNDGSTTQLRRGDGNWPATWTAENPGGGATAIDDLTSSGGELFAAQGNVYRRTTGAVWSTYTTKGSTNIDRILWVKNRLMVTDGTGIYEVTASGGTLGSTITAIETLPTGWRFECMFEYGEYIYASAINTSNGTSKIHHYGPNQDYSAIEKKGETEMPRGTLIYAGASYLGLGYLGGGVANPSGGYNGIVFNCFNDARGFLTLQKLLEDKYTGYEAGSSNPTRDRSVRCFEPYGDSMYFGWRHGGAYPASAAIDGFTGYGVHNLARDSVCLGVDAAGNSTTNGHVASIKFFNGRLLLLQQNGDHYYQNFTLFENGFVVTSVADFNNAGVKVWDTFEAKYAKLAAGHTISISYLTGPDSGDTQSTIISDSVVGSSGQTATDTSNNAKSRSLLLMAQFSNVGSSAMTLYNMSARANSSPATPEYVLTRTFRLFQKDRRDSLGRVIYGDPVTDFAWLRSTLYNWVTLQEPGKTWTAFVVGVTDITPFTPDVRVSQGNDPARDGYIVQMQMVAR